MENEERYRAALACLALKLARVEMGDVSGDELIFAAQEHLRGAYAAAGMPLKAPAADT